MNKTSLTAIAATLVCCTSLPAMAACSLSKPSGDYIVSEIGETNDRTRVCYASGVLRFASSGTAATFIGRSSCTDEDPSTRNADFMIPATVSALDKSSCSVTIQYQDNNDGRYTRYRIYFDKTGTKFQGVSFEFSVGVGQIRGERQ